MITTTHPQASHAPKLHSGRFRREPKRLQTQSLQTTLAITIATMSTSRELPMPNISRISSLNQAQATLMHCLTKLTKFNQEQASAASYAWSPMSLGTERQTFQNWLERWEVAFGAFLSGAMATMNNEEVTLSRVLKSNHLACTILASDQMRSDFFDNEFRAIVELAGAVLRSRRATDSPQNTESSNPSQTATRGLDVRDPLLVVTSRCKQEALRARAEELLAFASS